MNSDDDQAAEGLELNLTKRLALSWASTLLTLSEQPDEVLVARVGLTMAQMDELISAIHEKVREGSGLISIWLQPGWEGAVRHAFSASFALVHDMQSTALTGWTKEERAADEAALAEALDAAKGVA